ncbi:MAG: hypothetical protein JO306_00110 [Gemmatimonadetes bacterium]|nr:hypothetical protein [Gemmatimonadota bacterium]
MNRIGRILAVTAGLIVGGALAGALAAVVALGIAVALTPSLHGGGVGAALQNAAMVGAVFGGVLFPAAGFIVLRRVPLGLALLGTLLGAVIGWFVPPVPIEHAINGALIGFVISTLLLRLTLGRASRVEGQRVPVA